MTTFKGYSEEEFKEFVSMYLNARLNGYECKWEWEDDPLRLTITRLNDGREIVNVPFEDYEIEDITMKDIFNDILCNVIDELNYILENTDIEDSLKNINELSQIAMELKNWIDYLEKEQAYEREIES